MEGYKRLARTLVAKGAIIDYYQDTMQIPNGNVAKWDLIDHKGAAAVVAPVPQCSGAGDSGASRGRSKRQRGAYGSGGGQGTGGGDGLCQLGSGAFEFHLHHGCFLQ